MSSQPAPVTAASAPFEQTTTPTIERANRLISLRTHPGFLDVLRISQEIVQSAIDTCVSYPGWDDKQMAMLAVRQKCAKEHHDLLLAKINEAIRAGVEEARSQVSSLPAKTAEESVDQGDFVRQKMLERFEDQDMRSAGSY